jgi:hypothetical protein
MNDNDLKSLLASWQAPDPSAALRVRAVAAFERTASGRPLWKRVLTTRVSLPLPVVAASLALVLTLGYFAMRTPRAVIVPGVPVVHERRVEVPVVHEKIITRTVYVRQPPAAAPAREAAASLAAAFQPVAVLKPEIIRRSYAQ